jgi:hypothetical protein
MLKRKLKKGSFSFQSKKRKTIGAIYEKYAIKKKTWVLKAKKFFFSLQQKFAKLKFLFKEKTA